MQMEVRNGKSCSHCTQSYSSFLAKIIILDPNICHYKHSHSLHEYFNVCSCCEIVLNVWFFKAKDWKKL